MVKDNKVCKLEVEEEEGEGDRMEAEC